MSRQVDVKALVSHIIRGDGADKCRICMGDTTEGQVYLGDIVIVEGDKSMTLSELLESVSGVEVLPERGLPSSICLPCNKEAQRAMNFQTLCKGSSHHWVTSVQLLEMLPDAVAVDPPKPICAVLKDDQIMIFKDSKTDSNDDNFDVNKGARNFAVRKRRTKKKLNELRCPDCGKVFSCPMLMYQHFVHSTDGKRACYICAKIMSRQELIQHLKTDHKSEPQDCINCPAIFQTKSHLNQHMKTAHSPGSHYCGDCGQNFSSMHAYNGHIVVHSTEKCPVCDKLFRNHCCYLYHIKKVCKINKSAERVHATKHKISYEVVNRISNKKIRVGLRGSLETKCICDYCGKIFSGKKTVCAHIQIVHMKNTHQPCPHCGKLYAAVHMCTHIQQKHSKREIYNCPVCSMEFKSKLGYVQHVRLHTGETPYKCKYCPERFSASSRRCEHVRKVHKKVEEKDLKHVCDQCPARFRLPYRLKKHIATVHNDDKKEVEYECGHCHVKFATCRGLVNHSKRHETFRLKSLKKNL